MLVKDESSRFGLPAFKFLGASWATYRLLVTRLGSEPDWATLDDLAAAFAPLGPLTLVTATDGNHGRAVARMARLLGLGARVFVAEGTAPARVAAIEGEGATVEVVSGDYDDAVACSAKAVGTRALLVSDTSWEGYLATPRRVVEGYATIFVEVDEALAALSLPAPDVVVIPVGVGALAAAAVIHYRVVHAGAGTVLAGVEPDGADCVLRSVAAGLRTTVPGPHRSMMVGLNCGTPSLVAWPLLSAGLDWCLSVDDERAAVAMRSLAAQGVVSGETGAASLAGLAALAGAGTRGGAVGLGESTTALVLCTEGATDPAHYLALVGRTPEEVALGAVVAGGDLAPHVGVGGGLGDQVRDDPAQLGRLPAVALVDAGAGVPAFGHADAAAGDVEDPAGDAASFGAGQPDDQGGDVVGRAGVEVLGLPRLDQLTRRQVLGHAGQGAGGHGVDRDAVAAEFLGGDDGEGGDAGLGRPVVGLTGIAVDPRCGGGVDDAGVVGLACLDPLAPVGGGDAAWARTCHVGGP